ncbi:MAG: hypothetical protein M1127_00675, partial [Patescibacteria group bacterium]|nr:hypothetical protein [Patescibacteria group bacterium]
MQGKITQIIGPVVDVEFPEGEQLPEIFTALKADNQGKVLILEVIEPLLVEA